MCIRDRVRVRLATGCTPIPACRTLPGLRSGPANAASPQHLGALLSGESSRGSALSELPRGAAGQAHRRPDDPAGSRPP
eukprot:3980321-Alexandrium_andersonii.AAC.1